MRVVPVLDLKGGVVVRGMAGRRHEYRPITSRLTASCRPLDVARAFREQFNLTLLYVADLDALAGAPPAFGTYAELVADGFQLWVDAGMRDLGDVTILAKTALDGIVAGLETLAGPVALKAIMEQSDPKRIVFSLDLKDGEPLGNHQAWSRTDAWTIAEAAVGEGVKRMIVLDLARVGLGGGTGTEALCLRLVTTFPELEVIAGGGVREAPDLIRLHRLGVAAVLVASALHDGLLARADFEGL